MRVRTILILPSWQVPAIALIGIVHRTIVFLRFRRALITLVAQHPDYVTMQLLPIEGYLSHFWQSMWLLQQSPPIDQVVMKAALAVASWPYGVAQLLVLFNGVLTIATSCLLYGIVARLTGSRLAGFCLACLFMLSTDTLVIEYALFGQMFYEMLAMLGATLLCSLLTGMEGGVRPSVVPLPVAAGLVTALLALTRSSFCYLAPALALFGSIRWRGRTLAAFLLPVLLLQGGWSAKNALLSGTFSLETSSWGGLNAERGLLWAGQQKQLCDEIVAGTLGHYPQWFVQMNRDCPMPFTDTSDSYVPDSVKDRDADARARLGSADPPWNSAALEVKARAYRTAILRFIIAHPGLAFDRFAIGYRLFWQRIADFGALLFDPLYVVPVQRSLLSPTGRGLGEKQRVMLTLPKDGVFTSRPTAFWTLSLAPIDAVSIATIHILFPLLLCLDVWRRRHGRRSLLPWGTAAPAVLTIYGCIMFCAFDVGENMRFRLAVEPEILALTAACLTAMAGWLAASFRRSSRRPGGPTSPFRWSAPGST